MEIYEPMTGENISETARQMIKLSSEKNTAVWARFNDIELTATSITDVPAIMAHYERESNLRHEAYVNSPEYSPRRREAEGARQRHDLLLKGALAVAPQMTLQDEKGWEEAIAANYDAYGAAVILFAERWARIMEGRIAHGDTVAGCAKVAAHLADNEGISSFMYGCAVSLLSQVWIHGEALRCWHNLSIQIRHEGEQANESGRVLNPALLHVDGADGP